MKTFVVAMAVALVAMPAYAQMGGINTVAAAGKAARPAADDKPADAAKKKADDKAFSDGVSRIPEPNKKFDPWGSVRQTNSK